MIKMVTNFKGEILWDKSKPDGTPRRLLDLDKLFSLGWRPKINLESGLKHTYEWFKNSYSLGKIRV
jgi:GDP-L-fucose synthase